MTNETKLSDWTADLNLPTGIAESFFRPESTPQRVVVMAVKGHGQDGIDHKLETKNEAGAVIETKTCKKFADVSVNTEDLARSMKWEVLSRPAALGLAAAIREHGPSWPGELVIDVQTSGRGKEKQFIIRRVSPESIDAERKAEAALAAAKSKAPVQPAGEPTLTVA